MLSDDITSVQVALGELAGRVGEEDWKLVSVARKNLASLAEQVQTMEGALVPGDAGRAGGLAAEGGAA